MEDNLKTMQKHDYKPDKNFKGKGMVYVCNLAIHRVRRRGVPQGCQMV
jgi:hypothetical protein